MPQYKGRKAIVLDEPIYARNRWILDQFNRYEEYYRTEIYRMIQNQRMYWGVNFGQWPAYAVEKLISQGRRPPTFNIIAKKIESQIGSYLSNGFDLKYQTKTGKGSHWPTTLMDMAFADSRNCDWETSKIISLRDMHVMVGYERMHISDKYDSDFGNIAWEPLPPTHVYIDPAWRSPYAFDIENYFEWGLFSVAKIVQLFSKMAERLKELKLREEIEGINYGEFMGGVQRYQSTEEKWGDFHRVITFHYVVREQREWEYDLVNRNPFPETGFDQGSSEDREIKQAYIQRMGLQEGDYTTVRQVRRVKRIESICPTLDNEMFLTAGKDKIQTNNCNIYPVGNQFYGQFRGVVDDLSDVQLSFNKGKMTIEDIQARTAKGAFILDEALTGGDQRKREEIESNWNNPAARIWVGEGSTAELGPHGGVIELKSHPPTPDMFRTTAENLDLADWLSTMPAAMDSRTESTTESGKLFQSKVQVGLVGQKYGMKIFERHELEKAQAYPLQAKLSYAGYPREFERVGKKGNTVINQLASDITGRKFILNDISVLPEMYVILVPSANGMNLRSELRAQYTDTLNITMKDPSLKLMNLILMEGIYDTQDLTEDKKEELKKAFELLKMTEAMNLTLNYKNLQMQFQQLGAPPEQQQEQQSVTQGGFDEKKAIAGTPQQTVQ